MTSTSLLLVTLLSAGFLILSLVAIGIVLVRLPEEYFTKPRQPWWKREKRWRGRDVARILAKNAAGVLLVAVGGLLALIPGVPGQSLLTIFMGLFLVDFPGKHRWQCWILRRKRLNRWVGGVRLRFGRRPFTLPEA